MIIAPRIIPRFRHAVRCFHADTHIEPLNLHQESDLSTSKSVELSFRVYKAGKHHVNHTSKFQGLHTSPIVMVHGLFGSKQNWVSVGKRITEITGKVTLGVDCRNHGDSPHSLPHDYMHLTSDLIRFLDKMRAEAGNDKNKPNWKDGAVLVGHSMGAKVVMLTSLFRPDLVSKLVVIDNSPVDEQLDPQFLKDLIGMSRVEIEQRNSLQGLTHKQQLKVIDKSLSEYEPSRLVRVFLMSNLDIDSDNKTSVIKFKIPVLNLLKHNIYEKLGQWPQEVDHLRFNKPVLIMRGLKSSFVTDDYIQTAFPQYFSNISTIDFDCGHWLVSEQPEKFVNETVKFLCQ